MQNEETSGEIRIMAKLAEIREQFHTELNAVRVLAAGKRAEEGHLIELHTEEIAELRAQADHMSVRLDAHDAAMKLIQPLVARCLAESLNAVASGHRAERKLNALLEKWGIEDPAVTPDDTPRLTRPKP